MNRIVRVVGFLTIPAVIVTVEAAYTTTPVIKATLLVAALLFICALTAEALVRSRGRAGEPSRRA